MPFVRASRQERKKGEVLKADIAVRNSTVIIIIKNREKEFKRNIAVIKYG